MKYRFRGPVPVDDGGGGLVRPLDVREFGTEPDWGPWELLDEPLPAAREVGRAYEDAPLASPPVPVKPLTTDPLIVTAPLGDPKGM